MKLAALYIIIFALGFLTHAFFFPDVLSNGIVDVKQVVIPNLTPTQAPNNSDGEFETDITFDGKNFNRNNITVAVGNYLNITNTSESLMWLDSNDPALATKRGFGKSEQIRKRMDELGQFVVQDKNNPSEKLVITVK